MGRGTFGSFCNIELYIACKYHNSFMIFFSLCECAARGNVNWEETSGKAVRQRVKEGKGIKVEDARDRHG